jgi:hypothetical protein
MVLDGRKTSQRPSGFKKLISTKRRVSADAQRSASTRKEAAGRRARRKVKISNESSSQRTDAPNYGRRRSRL